MDICKKSCTFAVQITKDVKMETICAIATAYGQSGIAVIRVSGEDAIRVTDGLFAGRRRLAETAGGQIVFGKIRRGDEVLDEVLASVFRAPHSYTGEDVVEISCHGSVYIQEKLLEWLIESGCRMARGGEFTQRAFLNGKMDLAQAEAVADLIAAQSKAEKDLALSQLRGSVSKEIEQLRERLLEFTSLIELELDFADHEELEFADRSELKALAEEIGATLEKLTGSFKSGNAIRHGIPVAIAGAPNAGKSTLLNALLGEERAIVSDIQGTTRDTIEDSVTINGILFRLTDTAGLRKTEDQLEQMGIARSQQAARKAQIILYVIGDWENEEMQLDETDIHGTIIRVYNKADLAHNAGIQPREGICISAKEGKIEPLKEELVRLSHEMIHPSGVMISNARHYEALLRALEAIRRVKEGLAEGLSGELLSMDLQDCLEALGEVTGRISSQEVLNTIFSKFCIGK